MNEEFLPFSKPSIDQAAIDEVVACLQSGWITSGPRLKKFEAMLQDYFDAEFVLPLSSGTAGLHLSLLALDLQAGDEVITTPMTFAATLNTIVLAGGKPVLVDVEADTYNLDVNQIEPLINEKTRAIIPVHFAGAPVDLDPIYALAKQYELRVIEDAAHAIGSEYKGKRIGSFGDTQIFSFHPNKNITTGEGGCVVTRDAALAKRIALLRFHGMDREAWDRFAKKGSQHYQIVAPGFKYNMLDMQAALGLHQVPRLESFIERRTQLAERYLQHMSDWPQWQLPQTPSYSHRHAWHLFAPLINPTEAGFDRDSFMREMKELNIGTGLHYQAVHLYDYYQHHFGFQRGDFPHAEAISDRIVSLPLFPDLSDAEQDRVIDTMRLLFTRQAQ